MTDYVSITNAQVAPKAPITSELQTALRDNPTAIAEGSSGAPINETAWHELEIQNPVADTGTITFATDISPYRSIKVIGGGELSGTTTVDLELFVNGGWRNVITTAFVDPGGAITPGYMVQAEIDNIDNNDSSNLKLSSGTVGVNTAGGGGWETLVYDSVSPKIGVVDDVGAATAVRINSISFNFIVATTAPLFRLYGIKRTQP